MSYFQCVACSVWVHISERRDRGMPVLGLPDDRCFPCWRARQRELFDEMVERAGPPPTGLLAALTPMVGPMVGQERAAPSGERIVLVGCYGHGARGALFSFERNGMRAPSGMSAEDIARDYPVVISVTARAEIGDPLRFDSHGSFDLEPEDGDGHDDW